MLWHLLNRLFYTIGKYEDEWAHRDYKPDPKFRGTWVNKGDDFNENWVWVDDETVDNEEYIVNVFMTPDAYIFNIGHEVMPGNMDYMTCIGIDEVQRTIEDMSKWYRDICGEDIGINIIDSTGKYKKQEDINEE